MAEAWLCKECKAILGWQDADGLQVVRDAVERYTLPSRSEEIWVTCRNCGSVQIWRARVELGRARRPAAPREQP